MEVVFADGPQLGELVTRFTDDGHGDLTVSARAQPIGLCT